jgi:O-antigen/teichoic acid export membrane protein
MMPLMVGLAVCAEPVVRLILTEKWLPAVFFLRIFCVTYAFQPIHTANLNAIKAMGRSDYFLRLEVIKKIVGIAALLATMFISVEAMAYSLLATTFLSQVINAWPNKKLLGYSYLDQLKDMLPQIVLSIIMGGIVFCVTFIPIPDWAQLIIQVPLGGIIYFVLAWFFKLESFQYVCNTAKSFLEGRRKKKAVKREVVAETTTENQIVETKVEEEGNYD